MKVISTVLCLLLIPVILWAKDMDLNYQSPDGNQMALIIPLSSYPGVKSIEEDSEYECKVEIHEKNGNIIWSHDFSSPNHEHGRGVAYASWTPDSEYFVFSTTSSGGHSPWHYETFAFSRKDKEYIHLDDYTGPIMNPKFVFGENDVVTVDVRDYSKADTEAYKKVNLNLHQPFARISEIKLNYEIADKELIFVYNLLKNICSPDEKKKLTEEQLVWLKYRDLCVAFDTSILKTQWASLQVSKYKQLTDLTKERVVYLKIHVENMKSSQYSGATEAMSEIQKMETNDRTTSN